MVLRLTTIYKLRTFIFLLAFCFAINAYLLTFASFSYAQLSSFGVATRVPVAGETVLDGYIVASTDEGYAVTTEAYQKEIAGVVAEKPAVEFDTDQPEDTYPLATSGEAFVWVTLANGEIKTGDPITSSPWAGIGMRGSSGGPTLGSALEDLTVEEGQDREKIVAKIRVSIQPTGSESTAATGGALKSILERNSGEFTSSTLIRFGVGSGIILLTVFISLWFFGGLAKSGVDALGRNPHASKKIQFGITINVLIGFLVSLIGIITALYIMN